MEKDKEKTIVIFRMWKGEVIALFPELPFTYSGYSVESYMRVGQHAAASYEGIILESRPATKEEYEGLFIELEDSFGYNLEVRTKRTPKMVENFRKDQKRSRTIVL